MYIPLYITILYLYFSVHLSSQSFVATNRQILKVSKNLFVTECLYCLGDIYVLRYLPSFSIINFILFILAQDVYFYFVHYIMHKYFYSIHALHHTIYAPFYAWYGSVYEHIFLNLGSIAIPFILFPNSSLIFLLIITLQTYTSVNGHTSDSPHSVHHVHPKRRLGSVYLIDRLMRTF